ncbi:MAG: SIS domain-containing protein [Deltaproteobacteria bacterium]|nr:SIS domain-containing protein [Deltaproteobacteria bacterium]
MSDFTTLYLEETLSLIKDLDVSMIEKVTQGLARVRNQGGRLFILGVGGSAAHASHAVNDFRKLCDWETYAPTDNVSELTARINDEGWESSFVQWLKVSKLSLKDALLIFSVGGGNREKRISMNLVRALEYALEIKASVFGIVGKDGGFTKQASEACIVVPSLSSNERVTPHTEGLCAVLWHLLVSHPSLSRHPGKWESLSLQR